MPAVVVHAFNSSTWEASLVYRVSSRTVSAIQRNPVSEKRKRKEAYVHICEGYPSRLYWQFKTGTRGQRDDQMVQGLRHLLPSLRICHAALAGWPELVYLPLYLPNAGSTPPFPSVFKLLLRVRKEHTYPLTTIHVGRHGPRVMWTSENNIPSITVIPGMELALVTRLGSKWFTFWGTLVALLSYTLYREHTIYSWNK